MLFSLFLYDDGALVLQSRKLDMRQQIKDYIYSKKNEHCKMNVTKWVGWFTEKNRY